MTTIIGYTDSINECDCCGKVELKGTYCVEVNGIELYFGSVCAFKNHGISVAEQKEAKVKFAKEEKNKKMYALHIAPIRTQMKKKLEASFTTNYENLTDFEKKIYNQIIDGYNYSIDRTAKKYKISLSPKN